MYYITILMIKNVNQISEQAFLLDFGNEITKEINQNVLNTFYCISKKMQKDNFLGLKNCVPSYNKLLIHFFCDFDFCYFNFFNMYFFCFL